MTAEDFRRLALSMPDASEVGHMGHPDFRVGGKIFATLGYPDETWGTLKPPEQQAAVVASEPRVFVAVKGGWGRRGRAVRDGLGVVEQRRRPRHETVKACVMTTGAVFGLLPA